MGEDQQPNNENKGGRPPVPDEEKIAKNRVTIYLNDAELEELIALAKHNTMSKGRFVKWAAFKFIRGESK